MRYTNSLMTEIEQNFLWYRPSPHKPRHKVTCPMLTLVMNKYSLFVTNLILFVLNFDKRIIRIQHFQPIGIYVQLVAFFACIKPRIERIYIHKIL